MAFVLADRVKETTNAPGTGNANLQGAVLGFQSFAVVGNGNSTFYTIADQVGSRWEVGIGTYNSAGPSLSRDTILASSSGGTAVNFNSGTQDIFITYPAEQSVYGQSTTLVAPSGALLPVANGGTGLATLSTGYIPYGAGTGPFGSSSNLFFDSGNIRFGVGTGSPAVTASFVGTDALLLPKGTTAQQPAGVSGYLRFNTDNSQFEGYNGSSWSSVGGAAISNDTSTASNIYPLLANATSGSATTVYTSNAKLLYKPSTGEFTSSTFIASSGFYMNPQTLPASYTVPASYSASSVGPITIPSGMSVTVSSGSRWVVL